MKIIRTTLQVTCQFYKVFEEHYTHIVLKEYWWCALEDGYNTYTFVARSENRLIRLQPLPN